MYSFTITFITMIAFAANSLLCRMALGGNHLDAGSFTRIRLCSGAITLAIMYLVANKKRIHLSSLHIKELFNQDQWLLMLLTGASLFGYAYLFSIAYISLATGTGALLLFGAVQITLLLIYRYQGNKLHWMEWLGLMLSISGFVILMLPSAEQPDLISAIMMMMAGVCWAVYTRLGQQHQSPHQATLIGFSIASLIILILSPWLIPSPHIDNQGILIALISGVVMSGIGYLLWYKALKYLSLLQASVSQLSVPIFALILGVIFLGEQLSMQYLYISIMILLGITLVCTTRVIQQRRALNHHD